MIGSKRPDEERKGGSSKSESEFMHGCIFVLREKGLARELNKMQKNGLTTAKGLLKAYQRA